MLIVSFLMLLAINFCKPGPASAVSRESLRWLLSLFFT